MKDQKLVGNPISQRQAKVVRAEIEDLKAEAKALKEASERKMQIAEYKEVICLQLETDGMDPQAAARWRRHRKPPAD